MKLRKPWALIAALIALTGCSANAPPHSAPAKTASPPAATPAAKLISAAAAAECDKFGPVWADVQQAFSPAWMKAPGTVAVVAKHWEAWSSQLDAAATPANMSGVPDGRNQARIVAQKMTMAAFDVGLAAVAAQMGDLDTYLKRLAAFLKLMKSVAARCGL